MFEAAVNTARLCLVLFLHLCHVKYCRPVDHPSIAYTSMETRTQGIVMCLQRATLDMIKVMSQ